MTTLRMSITYAIIVAALGLALSSSFITGALAANPHTGQGSLNVNCTTGPAPTFTLTCSGSVAGLGNINGAYVKGAFSGTYTCETVINGPVTSGPNVGFPESNGRTNFPPVSQSAPPVQSPTEPCPLELTGGSWSQVQVCFTYNNVLVGCVNPTSIT